MLSWIAQLILLNNKIHLPKLKEFKVKENVNLLCNIHIHQFSSLNLSFI